MYIENINGYQVGSTILRYKGKLEKCYIVNRQFIMKHGSKTVYSISEDEYIVSYMCFKMIQKYWDYQVPFTIDSARSAIYSCYTDPQFVPVGVKVSPYKTTYQGRKVTSDLA
jgi:hypothetical protein